MMPRPPRRRFRPLSLAALALVACSPPAPPSAQRPAAAPSSAAEEERATPWRTAEALAAALGPGVRAVPLLEVSDALHHSIHTAVAIARPGGAPGLQVELWRFTAPNPEDELRAIDEPQPLLRLRPGDPRAPALAQLRSVAAAPGNPMLRPRGLDCASPAALVARLADAAAIIVDESADAKARVDALAELIRGLDDALVLDRDATHEVIDAFAGGAPEISTQNPLGARRIRLLLVGSRPLELELTRVTDGCTVSDLRRVDQGAAGSIAPAAEPSPTAP